ncbi:MAG: NAD(P)H-dependent oxidoreductase, partial [Prevotella sp.]
MKVVIFNGSPRIRKHSNTDKIIASFVSGLVKAGGTYELFTLSDRSQWDAAREAFLANDNLLIALPLYVECMPGMLLEFLETIPTGRKTPAQLSFILQSGFDEGCQLRCGEAFLTTLPKQLGCTFGGVLVRGGNFGIRVTKGSAQKRVLKPYGNMGVSFARHGNFRVSSYLVWVGVKLSNSKE